MEQALCQAAISTFEELCFVFPTKENDLPDIETSECSSVLVEFNGELDGGLILTVEDEALSLIAKNMLGEDHAIDSDMAHDVLGELANVICGNVLPEITGTQHIFKLSAPVAQITSHSVGEPQASVRLIMDEGRADVLLYFK